MCVASGGTKHKIVAHASNKVKKVTAKIHNTSRQHQTSVPFANARGIQKAHAGTTRKTSVRVQTGARVEAVSRGTSTMMMRNPSSKERHSSPSKMEAAPCSSLDNLEFLSQMMIDYWRVPS